MGLSIHYSGTFKNDASLSEMIEEIKDIAEIYKWEYNIYNRVFPENSLSMSDYNQHIYGISFTPSHCETIFISFLSNGKMSSPGHLKFFEKSDDQPERNYLYMLSVKTQFAGVMIHKLVIHLFRYLSKKYFQDFNMSDEGRYWETGNEQVLKENFNRYNELLKDFSYAIEAFPMLSVESFESYFERVLSLIHDRKTKRDS